MKSDAPKVQKEAKPERDGVINQQKYNFNQFNSENFVLSKRCESSEVNRKTWLHVPSGTLWSTSSDTHQEVDIYKKDLY